MLVLETISTIRRAYFQQVPFGCRLTIAARERALASATENIGLNIVEAFPRIDLTG
jgi:hypothetical protein